LDEFASTVIILSPIFKDDIDSNRARVGYSPLFVLGGIQLSDLPRSHAELMDLFGLAPRGATVSSLLRNLKNPIIVYSDSGIVSVLLPTISSYASRHRASAWREELPQGIAP